MNSKVILNSPRAKSVDKKTAVKLINNYAESYKKKEFENALLQKQINDLQNNLKLNKTIIGTLTSSLPANEKVNELIQKLNDEISELYQMNGKLRAQLEESNDKVSYVCSYVFRLAIQKKSLWTI